MNHNHGLGTYCQTGILHCVKWDNIPNLPASWVFFLINKTVKERERKAYIEQGWQKQVLIGQANHQ